jgi:hypothetical protein
MAAKAQDYTKALNDFVGAFPVDLSVYEDAFKSQAALNEKFASVALEAAEKSNEVSAQWTKDAIAKIGAVAKAQKDPADYSKALADFASASAELAAENVAAYAEIAKRVQMETVELVLAAGKNISDDAQAAVQKATKDVTAAAKKASK